MASYEIRRAQDAIIIVSDADPTEVTLTPLNGTETDYFIEASTDHMWKRVGSDAAGYDYTDLGAIGGGGGGGGGGNVVDTLAATLVAGNTTGGNDIIMSSGDLITDDGTGGGVNILSTGGAGINLQTPAATSVNCQTPQFTVQDLSSNSILTARVAGSNPQVTLGASASGNGSKVYLNDVNKSLIMTTDTADLEVGINGAPVAGKALAVTGNLLVTGNDNNATILDVNDGAIEINLLVDGGVVTIGKFAGSKAVFNESAGTATLTFPNGVATSAGLTVGGVFKATAIATKSNDYTISAGDFFIDIDASANTVEITAPSATGQIAVIRANDITFAATVALTTTTYTFATAGDSVVVYYDGNNSRIISEYKQ